MKFGYEIYPTRKNLSAPMWQQLIDAVSEFQKPFTSWRIIILCAKIKIHYYLEIDFNAPANFHNLSDFLLQKSEIPNFQTNLAKIFYLQKNYNFIDLKDYLITHKKFNTQVFEFRFFKTFSNKSIPQAYAHGAGKSYQLLPVKISDLLAADFEHNHHLTYKSPPKYLDTYKALGYLDNKSEKVFLAVDAFPYFQTPRYLDQAKIDFAKHSLVLGASGSGKSKFLSLFIDQVAKNQTLKSKYKFVVIDPHAALENEIGQLGHVIDFLDPKSSIDLFSSHTENAVVAVELLLDIFKGLIANNYNSKLERVLRHSLYLLLELEKFNFHNLRKLLLDLDFRNQLLQTANNNLPNSVITFFYAEFSEIKVNSYTEAISPIIALIDEVEMIPIFAEDIKSSCISRVIQQNFLTIFSLDRTKFGDRVVKIVAGLIMQQVLTLAEQHTFTEHIIFIVDEVAVVENPILCRFLAEARKYHVSVILAGQYFGGISESLRQAIFANVINYYIFRIAKNDANLIVHNFEMKIPLSDTIEQKIKTLTGLQNRECVIRLSANDQLIPAFKATTLDFVPKPRIRKDTLNSEEKDRIQESERYHDSEPKSIKLDMATSMTLTQLLKTSADTIELTHETSSIFIERNIMKSNPKIHYTKIQQPKNKKGDPHE